MEKKKFEFYFSYFIISFIFGLIVVKKFMLNIQILLIVIKQFIQMMIMNVIK
jgi:hypothetical protein